MAQAGASPQLGGDVAGQEDRRARSETSLLTLPDRAFPAPGTCAATPRIRARASGPARRRAAASPRATGSLLPPQSPPVLLVQQVRSVEATRASRSCTSPALPKPCRHGPNQRAANRARQLLAMRRGAFGAARGAFTSTSRPAGRSARSGCSPRPARGLLTCPRRSAVRVGTGTGHQTARARRPEIAPPAAQMWPLQPGRGADRPLFSPNRPTGRRATLRTLRKGEHRVAPQPGRAGPSRRRCRASARPPHERAAPGKRMAGSAPPTTDRGVTVPACRPCAPRSSSVRCPEAGNPPADPRPLIPQDIECPLAPPRTCTRLTPCRRRKTSAVRAPSRPRRLAAPACAPIPNYRGYLPDR